MRGRTPLPVRSASPLERSIRDRIVTAVETAPDDGASSHARLSSTGYCLRRQTYNMRVNEDRAAAISSPWELRDGHVHEADVKSALRLAGYEVEDNNGEQETVYLPLPNGYRATPDSPPGVPGHLDGRIRGNELGDEWHLLEIKALGARSYADTVHNGLREAHPEYYDQSIGYMGATGVHKTVFVIKAKDSSSVKRMLRVLAQKSPKLYVEIVEFDEAALERVITRQTIVTDHYQDGTLPDREYDRDTWQCNYCPFVEQCWNRDP